MFGDGGAAVAVIFVEHGEHGYCGATIAKHIMQTYFAQRDGLPLPPLPLSAAPCLTAPAPAPAPAPARAAVAATPAADER